MPHAKKLTSPAEELSGMSRSAKRQVARQRRVPQQLARSCHIADSRSQGSWRGAGAQEWLSERTGANCFEAVALEEGDVGVQVVELLGAGGSDKKELPATQTMAAARVSPRA